MSKYAKAILSAWLLLTALGLMGCKKTVDKLKEDFVMNLITNNLWLVSSYKEAGVDRTSEFTSYEFKFNKDNTVYGRRTGFPDASGTWRGSSEDMSITSAFPASAAPLDKLTGKWMIKKTTLSSVNSTRTEGGITYELNLVKK